MTRLNQGSFRAVVHSEHGGAEVLRIVELPLEQPGPGEVRVAVRTAGVNPVDWKIRSGAFGTDGTGTDMRVGFDAAGVVDAVGPGTSALAIGDEVIVTGAHGAYAESLVVDAERLDQKPKHVGWDQAAGLGIPVSTAYQALKSLGVAVGDVLLVHGGAGAVGQAAIQLAVAAGAAVVATARPANHKRLRELGAVPVAYGEGLIDRARQALPGAITAALDAAGTDEAIQSSLRLVPDRSRIGTVVQGEAAASWGIRAWSGGSPEPLTEQDVAWRREATGIASKMLADGVFDIEISGRYPLEQVTDAHRISEGGHVRGKIVLHMTSKGTAT